MEIQFKIKAWHIFSQPMNSIECRISYAIRILYSHLFRKVFFGEGRGEYPFIAHSFTHSHFHSHIHVFYSCHMAIHSTSFPIIVHFSKLFFDFLAQCRKVFMVRFVFFSSFVHVKKRRVVKFGAMKLKIRCVERVKREDNVYGFLYVWSFPFVSFQNFVIGFVLFFINKFSKTQIYNL